MDTIQSFIDELDGYRKQLAQPYLKDTTEYMRLAKEALNRSQYEVKASHIMIRLDAEALPADTLKAYNKLFDARKKILAGTPFETIAKELSEDPSVKDNGGNQGYFSSMRFPYPFESAAFNTKVGGVSLPFRTAYGYHIVKVFDKRPSIGKVQVAHIMFATPKDMPATKADSLKLKATEVYDKIKGGADFAQLARDFSDDKYSAQDGGKLMWFGAGVMVPEFEQAAFALKNDGDISLPVRTSFGWHIIKRLGYQEIDNSEVALVEMEKKIRSDDRGLAAYDTYYQRVRNANNYKTFPENLSLITATFDTTIITRILIRTNLPH